MHKNKSYIELMALARIQMNGKASLLIGAMLMQAFIILFANSIGILLFPETDLISNILYFIITFIIQLFAGILQVGSCFLFLHAACNMPCQISDLFYAFKHSPDKAIKIQFAFALLDAICMIPANIVIFTTSNSLNYDTLLKTSIATLLGTIIYMLITLPLFPMFYLLLDFPNLTVTALFKKSFSIMKGNCSIVVTQRIYFFYCTDMDYSIYEYNLYEFLFGYYGLQKQADAYIKIMRASARNLAKISVEILV